METIRLDYYDYIENLDEICEQIYWEFGIVNIAIQIPSEREILDKWCMNDVALSQAYLKVNGKVIYGK